MRRLWRKLLDRLFPCKSTLGEAVKNLHEANEGLKWIVRALGICPDCEKSLIDCACKNRQKRIFQGSDGNWMLEYNIIKNGNGEHARRDPSAL